VLCHSSECLYNLEMEYRHKIPTEKKHLPNFKDLYAKIQTKCPPEFRTEKEDKNRKTLLPDSNARAEIFKQRIDKRTKFQEVVEQLP
jgi:hypothetical protein